MLLLQKNNPTEHLKCIRCHHRGLTNQNMGVFSNVGVVMLWRNLVLYLWWLVLRLFRWVLLVSTMRKVVLNVLRVVIETYLFMILYQTDFRNSKLFTYHFLYVHLLRHFYRRTLLNRVLPYDNFWWLCRCILPYHVSMNTHRIEGVFRVWQPALESVYLLNSLVRYITALLS